jgi:hypothetical protein
MHAAQPPHPGGCSGVTPVSVPFPRRYSGYRNPWFPAPATSSSFWALNLRTTSETAG